MRVLEAQGYSLLIADNEYSLEREEQLIQSFLERRPEAIILTGTEHSPRARRLLKKSGIITVETWSFDAPPLDLAVEFSEVATGLSARSASGGQGLSLHRLRWRGGGSGFPRPRPLSRARRRFEGTGRTKPADIGLQMR